MDPNITLLELNATVNETAPTVDEYMFDKPYVRFTYIAMYTVVFCLCFFGNLLVVLVVTLSRRLRSITNFFLANLAVADFCVGIFCVYQNLLNYLIIDWILGDFLCKMYHFVTSLSYTASIFILVVICTERYFAIIYAITCKQILTPRRLRLVLGGVWLTSCVYSSPKLFFVNTVTHEIEGKQETFCATNRTKYNSQLFDTINFILLYLLPLTVMSILYTRIAFCLWRSSKELETQLNRFNPDHYSCKTPSRQTGVNLKSTASRNSEYSVKLSTRTASSKNVLEARRGVIRMLIVVVLAFAVCNFPLHARKMWQYWSTSYKGDGSLSMLLTPLTFLLTYFNSAVNPLLYAFLSKNFRRGMKELVFCAVRRGRRRRLLKNQQDMSMREPIDRHTSMRSTIKNNVTSMTLTHSDPCSGCSHDF